MLRFMVLIVFMLSTVTSYKDVPSYSHITNPSAASSAQIKFAIENEYDDTGPGAKKPEYAYNTYKNLEDALIAYLNDPDTKLPEYERAKAIQKLILKSQVYEKPAYYQKQSNSLNKGFQKSHFAYYPEPLSYPTSKLFDDSKPSTLLTQEVLQNDFISNSPEKRPELRIQKFQSVKGSPLSLGHFTRNQKLGFDQFEYFPKQTYSLYKTGDLQLNAETRNAGVVHGYYTFIDADGTHRTVNYSAEDEEKKSAIL